MKIVLVNPPSDTYRSPEEHLGLSYIKSFLANWNYEVDIIDGYLSRLNIDLIIEQIISDYSCKIVGISPYIDSLQYALTISAAVKKHRPEIHICWGGHLATFSAFELLSNHNFIDSIVMGEGEQTFLELVQTIDSGRSLSVIIKGIAFCNGNLVNISPARNLLENLDILPFPDRLSSVISYHSGSLAQISGSRGCYGNCSFCSINSLYRLSDGKAWRGRSPENIVSELVELKTRYGFSSFKFVDDSFFGPGSDWIDRGIKIAEGIIQSHLEIRFRISIRANNVDEYVFQKLKEAGLYAVSIGIESGVQRMLNTFNKGIKVQQNLEALRILERLEVITLMGFIGFDPYVTIEEIKHNIDFLELNSFALTDLLSKSLYVHADDAITKKLLKEGLIIGRDFPNYQYKIIDQKAALVLELIEEWNLNNKVLYYKISNPLTAPRRTTKDVESHILSLSRELAEIDLTILKNIVKMIEIGYNKREIRLYLEKKKVEFFSVWNSIEERFSALKLLL